jgi:hypothetical protein
MAPQGLISVYDRRVRHGVRRDRDHPHTSELTTCCGLV